MSHETIHICSSVDRLYCTNFHTHFFGQVSNNTNGIYCHWTETPFRGITGYPLHLLSNGRITIIIVKAIHLSWRSNTSNPLLVSCHTFTMSQRCCRQWSRFPDQSFPTLAQFEDNWLRYLQYTKHSDAPTTAHTSTNAETPQQRYGLRDFNQKFSGLIKANK